MANIKISPDQVRQMSNQFKQASEQSRQMLATLNSSVDGAQGQWEGMTQQRFFQEYEQWKASMTQFAQQLDDISNQLNSVATRFETIDTGGG
jgi:WXG100 family type VII secretion target